MDDKKTFKFIISDSSTISSISNDIENTNKIINNIEYGSLLGKETNNIKKQSEKLLKLIKCKYCKNNNLNNNTKVPELIKYDVFEVCLIKRKYINLINL